MSGGLPQDNDRKRPRSGGSGLPSFSLRTASTHQRVQPAEDLTGATSAEDLTVDDQESPLVEPGTAVPARRFVRPTAVSNSLDIAADDAYAVALARGSEAIQLAQISAPSLETRLSVASPSAPAMHLVPSAPALAAGVPINQLPVRYGSSHGAYFSTAHPVGSVPRLPSAPLPEHVVVPALIRNQPAYDYFSPDGDEIANSPLEMDRLDTYLVAHPPDDDAGLAAIEESYIQAHGPWSPECLAEYRDNAAFRKHCAQMGDGFTRPDCPYAALLHRYQLPPLRRMSLIRNVAVVVPDHATLAIRRALVGVLNEMPLGYCRSLVGTFYSFLSDARWLCPFGLSADSYDYWAHFAYSEPIVPAQHAYLDHARVQSSDTAAAALTSLAARSARLESIVASARRGFLRLMVMVNDPPPRLDLSTPASRAMAKYLDWA